MKVRKRLVFIPSILALGALVLSLRLWNRRFVTVSIQNICVDVDGQPKQGRRITIQSIFNLPPQETWRLVQTPRLLSQITRPVLIFSTLDGQPLPDQFFENQALSLKIKGMGVLPLGRHTITVESIDHQRRELRSNESGQIAQVWRHLIAVNPYGPAQTLYTDQVDLYAGGQTSALAAFARFFYMYRHTRWQQLHTLPRPQETAPSAE
jgi:hypothetical protein